ncbi:MAG: UDP-2,3-diacylglucosamine diphosphatase [Cytophagales bacterium]|nr:UDP-2,3-diacylglucosamine diphosphatase [Cytophagales bacterium]
MIDYVKIAPQKKLFFASDFHLGAPVGEPSRQREKRILHWIESIEEDCEALFLLGDVFDFWFEYRKVVPKHFVRLLGKLAELSDRGVAIHLFAGNHDMWSFGYLEQELGLSFHRDLLEVETPHARLLVGHGDGLGPHDRHYKVLKRIFRNVVGQRFFAWLHPDLGVGLAQRWSRHSRLGKDTSTETTFHGSEEWLYQYCLAMEKEQHFDYYLFGHRHLPLTMEVGPGSQYINLGEWLNYSPYAVYENGKVSLAHF